jgi:hypothetical protein
MQRTSLKQARPSRDKTLNSRRELKVKPNLAHFPFKEREDNQSTSYIRIALLNGIRSTLAVGCI